MCGDRFRAHPRATAGSPRRHIAAVVDAYRIDEVFVQVIDRQTAERRWEQLKEVGLNVPAHPPTYWR